MAWTQEQLDELDKLIASGESSAAYGDRRLVYRSLEELRQIRDQVARQMQGGGGPREIRTKAQFSKGLE